MSAINPKQDIGPGNYDPKIESTKPNLSTNLTINPPSDRDHSVRLFQKKVAVTPGPGTYNNDTSFNKTKSDGPSFSISKTAFRKDDWSKIEQSKYPGPGEYNADKNLIKSRPQTAFISKAKRAPLFDRKDLSPGPNAYNPSEGDQSYSARGPVFTGRGKDKRAEPTPGPG